MATIDIDNEVFDKLTKLAIPFVDLTPNHVIRRMLGMNSELAVETRGSLKENALPRREIPSAINLSKDFLSRSHISMHIDELYRQTIYVNSGFLTFLIDKYFKTEGNFKSSYIIDFMEKFNLHTDKGYRNPWMSKPYKNKNSCDKTIYHFNQCRKYGCWNNKDSKRDCSIFSCEYHPRNNSGKINKCDLEKGVIWKKENPHSLSFRYGNNYLEVINKEIIKEHKIPLKLLLNIFYPKENNDSQLMHKFKIEFNLKDNEMDLLFDFK